LPLVGKRRRSLEARWPRVAERNSARRVARACRAGRRLRLEQHFPISFHSPIITLEGLLCGACLVGSTEVIHKLPKGEQLAHGYNCVVLEDVNDIAKLSGHPRLLRPRRSAARDRKAARVGDGATDTPHRCRPFGPHGAHRPSARRESRRPHRAPDSGIDDVEGPVGMRLRGSGGELRDEWTGHRNVGLRTIDRVGPVHSHQTAIVRRRALLPVLRTHQHPERRNRPLEPFTDARQRGSVGERYYRRR
jgi:hypothetical protein